MIIRKMITDIRTTQVNEVINYLVDILHDEFVKSAPISKIAFDNYIFDTHNLTFEDINPQTFTPIKLNVAYNPNIINENPSDCFWILNIISEILSGDQTQIDLFFEIMGYCLVPHTAAQKAFIFFGKGSNGKSLLTEKLMRPLFDGYTSSLSIKDLSDRFKVGLLDGSLVNIDADTEGATIQETANFKKLATGDEITVDVKYEKPYTIENTCKLIASFNDLPRSRDISPGFTRRILILPFYEVFSYEKGNLDSKLEWKIKQKMPTLKEFLLVMAIDGLKRLKDNKWKFSENEKNEKIKGAFMAISDTIKAWLDATNYEANLIVGRTIQDVHNLFKAWCDDEGLKPMSKNAFARRIREKMGLVSKKRYINGLVQTVFDYN